MIVNIHTKNHTTNNTMSSMAAENTSIQKQEKAIIFGVRGIVGRELAKTLIATKPNCKVYGVSRNPDKIPIQNPNYHFISCDLLNLSETQQKLSSVRSLTHVFWATWASQFPIDSEQSWKQNKIMLSNAMEVVLQQNPNLKHFSLQTGMRYYASYSGGYEKEEVLYDEESPRTDSKFNYFYGLEDTVKEKLKDREIGWSVQRPGLVIGSASNTLYNIMGCLCVYGVICKYLNLPFVFGGTKQSWEERCIEVSDARLVAEQHIWAGTSEVVGGSKGEAFNAINGFGFIWKEIWPIMGEKFGVKGEIGFDEDYWYRKEMGDKRELWREIVEKEGLVKTEIEELCNWDMLDGLFRNPIKVLGKRYKADRFGFTMKFKSSESVLYWIDYMRYEKYIP